MLLGHKCLNEPCERLYGQEELIAVLPVPDLMEASCYLFGFTTCSWCWDSDIFCMWLLGTLLGNCRWSWMSRWFRCWLQMHSGRGSWCYRGRSNQLWLLFMDLNCSIYCAGNLPTKLSSANDLAINGTCPAKAVGVSTITAWGPDRVRPAE